MNCIDIEHYNFMNEFIHIHLKVHAFCEKGCRYYALHGEDLIQLPLISVLQSGLPVF